MAIISPIRSLEDVPADRRRGGAVRLLLSPRSVGSTSGFMGMATLAPGERIAEHYHPYSEEFLHVIAGELEMSLDGEAVRLGPGDSLIIPIGVRHRLVNVGAVAATGVFHLSPLAERPELGHVDTEEVALPELGNPQIGSAR